MLQGLALGALGSLASTALDAVLKDKNAVTTDGFTIANVGRAATGVTEETYNDTMDAGAKDALAALREMTQGGIEGFWKWMMKELRKDVMEDMGVTEESLAAMDPEQRAATENAIEEEIQKRLKQAMGVGEEGNNVTLKAEDMVEKVKQAMQAAQKEGYQSDKTLLGIL